MSSENVVLFADRGGVDVAAISIHCGGLDVIRCLTEFFTTCEEKIFTDPARLATRFVVWWTTWITLDVGVVPCDHRGEINWRVRCTSATDHPPLERIHESPTPR